MTLDDIMRRSGQIRAKYERFVSQLASAVDRDLLDRDAANNALLTALRAEFPTPIGHATPYFCATTWISDEIARIRTLRRNAFFAMRDAAATAIAGGADAAGAFDAAADIARAVPATSRLRPAIAPADVTAAFNAAARRAR